EFHGRIDEWRLLQHTPWRCAVERRTSQQTRFRQAGQRRDGLEHLLPGVAEVAAQRNVGQRHTEPGLSACLRRRRRGLGGFFAADTGGGSTAAGPPPAGRAAASTSCGNCWACAHHWPSSRIATDSSARSSRKSNAARKRGWAIRRNTRLRWICSNRGCNDQISSMVKVKRRGIATRWHCSLTTWAEARAQASVLSWPRAIQWWARSRTSPHSNTANRKADVTDLPSAIRASVFARPCSTSERSASSPRLSARAVAGKRNFSRPHRSSMRKLFRPLPLRNIL